MRRYLPQQQHPLLWVSSYQAYQSLAPTPQLVEEGNQKIASSSSNHHMNGHSNSKNDESSSLPKELIIRGYEAQNEMLLEQFDQLIKEAVAKHESIMIEVTTKSFIIDR